MIELLRFDEVDFFWDMPRHNQRLILASRQVEEVFNNLGIDLDRFVKRIAKSMTKKDMHYCMIGKQHLGFYVELHRFSQETIDWCKKTHEDKQEPAT